jgi:hypothetical protein
LQNALTIFDRIRVSIYRIRLRGYLLTVALCKPYSGGQNG